VNCLDVEVLNFGFGLVFSIYCLDFSIYSWNVVKT